MLALLKYIGVGLTVALLRKTLVIGAPIAPATPGNTPITGGGSGGVTGTQPIVPDAFPKLPNDGTNTGAEIKDGDSVIQDGCTKGFVGLRKPPSPHLGELCHEMAEDLKNDTTIAMKRAKDKDHPQEVELKNGKIMLQKEFQWIPDNRFKVALSSVLESRDGNENIYTKVYMRDDYIKVIERTYIRSVATSHTRIFNERVLQFAFGSAQDTLVALTCKAEDKRTRNNMLSKIKEIYPEAICVCPVNS